MLNNVKKDKESEIITIGGLIDKIKKRRDQATKAIELIKEILVT